MEDRVKKLEEKVEKLEATIDAFEHIFAVNPNEKHGRSFYGILRIIMTDKLYGLVLETISNNDVESFKNIHDKYNIDIHYSNNIFIIKCCQYQNYEMLHHRIETRNFDEPEIISIILHTFDKHHLIVSLVDLEEILTKFPKKIIRGFTMLNKPNSTWDDKLKVDLTKDVQTLMNKLV